MAAKKTGKKSDTKPKRKAAAKPKPAATEEQWDNSGKPGRPENLKPFPPGVSGNPGGRPKGSSLTSRLREALASEAIDGKPIPGGKSVADLMVEALIRLATSGDRRAIKDIFERVEGKAVQAIELSGPEGKPVKVDLSRLSTSELDDLGRIVAKLAEPGPEDA